MKIDFLDYCSLIVSDMPLLFVSILIGGVIFVNGWTDAPGAITASVSTGALKMKQATVIAAIFNFIGAVTMGIINSSVIKSMGNITMMIGNGEKSVIVLGAAMISIIIWAVLAWYFGIPTSESHALVSGIIGAALAAGVRITNESITGLKLAISGLIFSLPIGGLLAYMIAKILKIVLNNTDNIEFIRKGQIFGAAAMSFMHGAQDSQKFAGVLIAAICMSRRAPSELGFYDVPLWLTLLCSVIIAVGTSVGGYRIIKKMGMETVHLTPIKGLAADISASICMLLASLGGIPVSTTHTTGASVVGAGLSEKGDRIRSSSLREMILAWVLTFPCCGILSYVCVKLLLLFVV